MKMTLIFFLFLLAFSSCSKEPSNKDPSLKRLMMGNERFVMGEMEHRNRSKERRKELASKQNPFAIIVGCSDSRVVPEIIFDEGLGDLFVIRVAGNIIGPTELDSIEYAAVHLGSRVILVLGHENCGAVDAVFSGHSSEIPAIASYIKPAVREAKDSYAKNKLEEAIKQNALNMKAFLEKTPVVEELIQKGKIEISAAYYDLGTGRVELLDHN